MKDTLDWNHCLGQDEYHQEKTKKYIALLSTPQRKAVIEYFKYCCTDEGVYDPDQHTLEIIAILRG